MNISGYTLSDNEDFCLYWIGQHSSIGYDIDKINFSQIFSLCVRNTSVASPYFNQLRLIKIIKTTNTLILNFIDDVSTSSSEKSVTLTSDNILQDTIFDLVD